jgi:ankyrin repeat protein
LLIDAGSSVTTLNSIGWTPLYIACINSDKEIVQLLIDAGSSVTTLDSYGQTPLHVACLGGHIESVQLLIDAGSSVTTLELGGRTALDLAKQYERGSIVEYLQSYVPPGAATKAASK